MKHLPNIPLEAYGASLRLALPSGDAGVVTTLHAMAAMADHAVSSGGPVTRIGHRIAAHTGRGLLAQLRGVYDFLRSTVVFKRDAHALEVVRHPDQLALEIEADGRCSGDCDDVATFGAALVRCLGVDAGLTVASARPDGQFHHVLFSCNLPGSGWSHLDPQEGFFGQLPPMVQRSLTLSLAQNRHDAPDIYRVVLGWLNAERKRVRRAGVPVLSLGAYLE